MLTVSFPVSALNSPVIIAVIMDIALAVKEQPVLATLVCQRAIDTQVELIAVLGVFKSFDTNWRAMLGAN